MEFQALRQKVLDANLALPALDLVVFTWGNVSQVDREENVFAIKPSGVAYDVLTLEDIVVVSLETLEVVSGEKKPSSDMQTHALLYKEFPTISGICHTHSPWAVSFAQAKSDLEAYGTTHADAFYGPVPCTRDLRDEEIQGEYEKNTGHLIVECFRDRGIEPSSVPAVLVAGHGPFTWGNDAMDAVKNSKVLEECAKMAARALRVNPEMKPISQTLLDKHYYRKHGKNAYYGQS